MPPKKDKKKGDKPKEIVRVDIQQHSKALADIEQRIQQSMEMRILAEIEAEEEGCEEMSDYEESVSEYNFPIEEGRLDLSFKETKELYENSLQCYPPSYYTIPGKERLLLLYAENFRKQFVFSNPKRRPLVLGLQNECDVQKFVCTTIRPTAFLHIPLIADADAIASFVADFITYEPLEEFDKIPTRLISPATLLRRRQGNSFEMATLLCSMLIGAGYPAMVVSGVARSETILNDQTQVEFPYTITELEIEEKKVSNAEVGQKYKLKAMPDLNSYLEENMAEVFREKENMLQAQRDEILKMKREALELKAVDRHHYKRSHAWVVILENAPWSVQPKDPPTNKESENEEQPIIPHFIEPTTGLKCDTHCKEYILIDSVWNNFNYYVNKQKYKRVGDIHWDLADTDKWEHLLLGEPWTMRKHKVVSDENLLTEQVGDSIWEEKHLDIVNSWVMRLHIGDKEFEERFPKLEKTIYYHRLKHERYSPYTHADGKVQQIIIYEDDEYVEPLVRYEYYENRADKLVEIKYTYLTQTTESWFKEGRNDNLKYTRFSEDSNFPVQYFYFYWRPRLDALKYLEKHPSELIFMFESRSDRCYYQNFEFKPKQLSLKKVVEQFRRSSNKDLPAYKDIAVRTFNIARGKIFLKFQYAPGALTSSTREFTKPPKPNYGDEIKFDPSLTKAYKSVAHYPDPTSLELYNLLLEQLKAEDKAKHVFERRLQEITDLIELRQQEMSSPTLIFSILDPLRNGAARALRLKEYEDEQKRLAEVAANPPDYLAPYLVPYQGREPTEKESIAAYNACLNSLKTHFVELLNALQRQYEDLTNEAKSLNKFIDRFENQFKDHDYQQLVKEARDMEINKRMLQLRITLTHEESQKKYESVKERLCKDKRLNMRICKDSEGSLENSIHYSQQIAFRSSDDSFN